MLRRTLHQAGQFQKTVARTSLRQSVSSWRSAAGARHVLASATAATTLAISLGYITFQPLYLKDEELLDPSAPEEQATGRGLIPYSEVNKHSQPDDCWVVIEGKMPRSAALKFAENHPGGTAPIYRAAGKDATGIFAPIHPPGTIENGLDPEACIGTVDPATLPEMVDKKKLDGERTRVDLAEIIGLPDFDAAAKANLTSKAWAYMSSGATDQYTLDLNRNAFNSILFRPRILVDVENADTMTKMMGQDSSLPIFIAPTGMAKLAHPEGECLLAKAAGQSNIIQMISTNASAPLTDIIGSASNSSQTFFMQLYVNRNRAKTELLLEKIHSLDLKAIFVTVDAAAPGKREADERSRAEVEVASGISGGKIGMDNKGGGIGRSVGSFIDPKLSWKDIEWLRERTKLPIGLKGIQTVEDAMKAAEMGVDAIYLSNHGGRALDGSPPALYTLLEMNKICPEVFRKCEVYIDGGCRRGTDVVKALCLGAKGVGMGRPFLYSLTYGEEGVMHAIEIMRDEIETTLKLLGVTKLDQLGPHLLNTKAIDPLVFDHPVWG
nr:L-lactate dehydrogenase (cytochrome) [Cryptococcus depauperatus CBS 7841]